jgi:hypothetical protein
MEIKSNIETTEKGVCSAFNPTSGRILFGLVILFQKYLGNICSSCLKGLPWDDQRQTRDSEYPKTSS